MEPPFELSESVYGVLQDAIQETKFFSGTSFCAETMKMIYTQSAYSLPRRSG